MDAIPVSEFDEEMKSTRRLLERVPDDKSTWKPHEKSFSLGQLAQLVAAIPSWITRTLRYTEIDLGREDRYKFESTKALVEVFDQNVKEARQAISEVTGKELETIWSLKFGENILMSSPKGVAVRQHLNHFIHHRGQLTVYARLIDVPVPSIYGPTADEKTWG